MVHEVVRNIDGCMIATPHSSQLQLDGASKLYMCNIPSVPEDHFAKEVSEKVRAARLDGREC